MTQPKIAFKHSILYVWLLWSQLFAGFLRNCLVCLAFNHVSLIDTLWCPSIKQFLEKTCNDCRMVKLFDRQSQEGRAALAGRGITASAAPQEAQAALPQGQLDHPIEANASEPRLGHRLRPRQAQQWAQLQDADGSR